MVESLLFLSVANKKKAVIRNYLVNRGGPLAPLLMDDMKEAMQKVCQEG